MEPKKKKDGGGGAAAGKKDGDAMEDDDDEVDDDVMDELCALRVSRSHPVVILDTLLLNICIDAISAAFSSNWLCDARRYENRKPRQPEIPKFEPFIRSEPVSVCAFAALCRASAADFLVGSCVIGGCK